MESFSFVEGTLYLWTGQNPSSAVAYVQDTNVTCVKGINNLQSVNGVYHNIVTGYRADVVFSVAYTPDMALWRLFRTSTAVHMKIDHAHAGGSAGVILYSGVFDSFSIDGRENSIFLTPMTYHANNWSAYGQ